MRIFNSFVKIRDKNNKDRKNSIIETLEPRVLYSVDLSGGLVDGSEMSLLKQHTKNCLIFNKIDHHRSVRYEKGYT